MCLPEIWEEEYDPIHVLLRAVHRREYQGSLDRYCQYLRQNNKLSTSRPPWPPFRIPSAVFEQFQDPQRILHCKTMHGIIFTILYRAVNDPDIPEQILSFCIYLLDLAIRFPISKREIVKSVVITEKVVMSMRMVEEMEVDEEVEEDMEMGSDGYTVYDVHSPIIEEDYPDPTSQHPQLPASTTQLALPSAAAAAASSTATTVAVAVTNNVVHPMSINTQLIPFATPNLRTSTLSTASSASSSSTPQDSTRQQLALPAGSSSYNMALIPTSEGLTTVRPKCMKLKQVPGRHRMLLSDKGLPLAIGSSESDNCSESRDSYKPRENYTSEELNSRIGDGVMFAERLLNQIASSNIENLSAIQNIRQKIWPQKIDVESSPSSENMDKSERRRRAKERQQKLMAEFASKQKAFMQKAMETDSKEGTSSAEEVFEDIQKEYECVICSQMSASEEDRPVGMVVLLQATSVAGHSHQIPNRTLPCDEKDRGELQKGENIKNWPMVMNIGWEGGVHVQTCGHYLHIDCHKAYILSLKNQNQLSSRLQNLAVEHGEYYCPLCRQLSNSVIPLRPGYRQSAPLVRCPKSNIKCTSSEISNTCLHLFQK
ncbi:e3 ubiquitin-protein ligase ubr3 [Caerostris extrusa]|uniref:E3 ubiquitin-protein ligase n=1 Tax=Caerostris extrusa TaxID=172846 RepID=A0AAV4XS87_CAEEX|nr:e3 ubiquitin-protein ligase ubr3 [Caerostris extrusa]